MFAEANEPYPVSACHELLATFDTMHHSLLFLLDSLISHSLDVCTFLITLYSSSLRGNPLPPAPSGGHARPASLLMPCYMPRDLSYSCASKYQLMTSKYFSPAYMSLLNSQTNTPCLTPPWNPQQNKPQTPKFHYAHNRVHHLPAHVFLLLGLLSKGGALQQPSCSDRKSENCTSLLHPLK